MLYRSSGSTSLPGGNELIHDDLSSVDEVTELGFP